MNAPLGVDGRRAPPSQGVHRMNLSAFSCLTDPRPQRWRASLDSLCRALTRHRFVDHKQAGPLWSAASFEAGAMRRSNAAVRAVACVVLDVDGGWTIDAATTTWGRRFHIVHTTWSHTASVHRFRVVVPLDAPAPVAKWAEVFAGAQAFSGGRLDPSTKDPARVWYLPSAPSRSAPRAAFVHPGPLATWQWFTGQAPAPTRPRPTAGLPPAHHASHDVDADADEIAAMLGADVRARVARFVQCPRCGDASVWFPMTTRAIARCNHRNTCGWAAPLAVLLRSFGHVY